MNKKSPFKILNYKNYLNTIKKSEKSKLFRNFYVLDKNKERDILEDGNLSCARYVSCILKIFDLISETHASVEGAIKDILNNGWKETEELIPGNILVWEKKEGHYHIGFCLGKNKAISNFDKKRIPIIHHYTFNNKRKIIRIFTHKIIGND